jgi:hypothetical protein
MKNVLGTRHSLPTQRTLSIIAQDPSVKIGGKILTTEVEIPAEMLAPGPTGYRVTVVDYDATNNVLYEPAVLEHAANGIQKDAFTLKDARGKKKKRPKGYDRRLRTDPRFHAQNAYAIVMRTLARFEHALGRRVKWGSDGHQIHVVPHAFAEANAFYSRDDRGIFFGYFTGEAGQPVYTCLSHDIVAHETTHALLDGLRGRYIEPSSPDQDAFHEGFGDIVALLSIFSLEDVVGALLDRGAGGKGKLIEAKYLTREKLRASVLLGLAEEMGEATSGVRGDALRRSALLPQNKPYLSMEEFLEPHRRGELLVAGMLNAFIDIWLARLAKVGAIADGKKDRSLVVEEGARVADHLLTMSIRAIDYCPPTDITFSDYLSALLTIDREVVPDDSRYGYRQALKKNFAAYGIEPDKDAGEDGTWERCDQEFVYSRSHFDSMLRDEAEVFRFIWENREALEIDSNGYIEVQSVLPSHRIGPDGFILRETVAEYVQIMTLKTGELKAALGITPPKDMPEWMRVRLFGGGALIFDEYGQLKYQIRNRLEDAARQTERLRHLWQIGFFERPDAARANFARRHLARAMAGG